MNRIAVAAFALILGSCAKNQEPHTVKGSLTELSNYYADPTAEKMYSHHVRDTFKIFKTTPESYTGDSTRKYPLIIILDANAFFETTVAELKFNSFIGMIPESVVIGIGYSDFPTMDSLRSRDYTYPVAIPEYEMALSGGADQFKTFIDEELLPKLTSEYRIDMERSVICGHSLGGYFTLYYGLKSIEENKFTIRNIVSASPSLHYNNRYLFDMEKSLGAENGVPLNIYISMGSDDMADESLKGILGAFEKQMRDRHYSGLQIKAAEFTNFGHIDAAVPGFIKGLTYIYEK